MNITVTFQNGLWVTDPSPAIVAIKTEVRWILRAPELANRLLRWEIRFAKSFPFGSDFRSLVVTTQRVSPLDRQMRSSAQNLFDSLYLSDDVLVDHRGATKAHSADLAGDYKYDLSVRDAETNEAIGNDDPWLYVVTSIVLPKGVITF